MSHDFKKLPGKILMFREECFVYQCDYDCKNDAYGYHHVDLERLFLIIDVSREDHTYLKFTLLSEGMLFWKTLHESQLDYWTLLLDA